MGLFRRALRQALDVAEQVYRRDDPQLIGYYKEVFDAAHQAGRLEEGHIMAGRIRDLRSKLLSHDHRHATVLDMEVKLAAWEADYRTALKRQREALGAVNLRAEEDAKAVEAEEQVQVLQDARIVPDERSNSLIVFANRQDMKMITNIVAKVDRLMAQVVIDAIIMDVQLTDTYQLGISWLMRPQTTGGLTQTAASNNGNLITFHKLKAFRLLVY